MISKQSNWNEGWDSRRCSGQGWTGVAEEEAEERPLAVGLGKRTTNVRLGGQSRKRIPTNSQDNSVTLWEMMLPVGYLTDLLHKLKKKCVVNEARNCRQEKNTSLSRLLPPTREVDSVSSTELRSSALQGKSLHLLRS